MVRNLYGSISSLDMSQQRTYMQFIEFIKYQSDKCQTYTIESYNRKLDFFLCGCVLNSSYTV